MSILHGKINDKNSSAGGGERKLNFDPFREEKLKNIDTKKKNFVNSLKL